MPRGKTPSLLSMRLGKPVRAEAKRRCSCNRCGSEIESGDSCFDIPTKRSGFTGSTRYCSSCTTKIIEQTEKELLEVKESLDL